MKHLSKGIVLCALLVGLTAYAPARPTSTERSESHRRAAAATSPIPMCRPTAPNHGAEAGTNSRLPYCHCSWSEGSCSTWVDQFAQEWAMHINCGGNTYNYQGSGEWGGLCRPGWECSSGGGHDGHNTGHVPRL